MTYILEFTLSRVLHSFDQAVVVGDVAFASGSVGRSLFLYPCRCSSGGYGICRLSVSWRVSTPSPHPVCRSVLRACGSISVSVSAYVVSPMSLLPSMPVFALACICSCASIYLLLYMCLCLWLCMCLGLHVHMAMNLAVTLAVAVAVAVTMSVVMALLRRWLLLMCACACTWVRMGRIRLNVQESA